MGVEKAQDKQCDEAQSALQSLKDRLHRKNQQLREVQEQLGQSDKEKAVWEQRARDLEKEVETHKFVLSQLEEDNNAALKQTRQRRQQTHSVLDRVIRENRSSQKECNEILRDIADDDEDSDLVIDSPNDTGNSNGNGNGSSQINDSTQSADNSRNINGRKRRRSVDVDEEEEHGVLGDLSPVPKKARHGARRKETSTTPFKAGKGIYKAKKGRSKNHGRLPKPRITD